MGRQAFLMVAILFAPALSGCLGEFFGGLRPPDAAVEVTTMQQGTGAPGDGPWNRQSTFIVRATSEVPRTVRIEATSTEGRTEAAIARAADAQALPGGGNRTEASLQIPDGIWEITFWVDDFRWDTLHLVHIDTTAPSVTGLETLGEAVDGAYVLGQGARVDPDGLVQVTEQQTGRTVATGLPVQLSGLADGIHAYNVLVEDEAGNQNIYTVQVRAGSATALPDGQYTMGIVARYTNQLALWDLSQHGSYLTPAEARSEVGGSFLSSGFGITPDHPDVQAVVDEVVTAQMNTMEAAWALYVWFFDELDYDQTRLDESDLLEPRETLQAGGGVCRDLAGLYVSLLRAAGIPARVVTGYLAGNVDGFHAWVEFYAGSVEGQSPWVPVDVSPVDGPFDDEVAMQAFGIRRPDYLTLRQVPTSSEVAGWSTAISVQSTYYADEPRFAFEKALDVGFLETRALCVELGTQVRFIRATVQQCHEEDAGAIDEYPWRVEQTIDYGVQVMQADDATLEVEISYPFAADVAPDDVLHIVYGPSTWQRDDAKGRVLMTYTT